MIIIINLINIKLQSFYIINIISIRMGGYN